jgi:hypothetical protein
MYVQIDQIEYQIIGYIDKHQIKYCDYLKNLADRYGLKKMYICIHNQKFLITKNE